MTTKTVGEFEKAILANVIELSRTASRRDQIVVEKSADHLETLFGTGQRDLAVRNLELNSIKLKESNAALARIADGTYGICLECEEPISAKRLAALPTAALCIRCQEAADCRCGATNVRTTLAMAA